ncbi:MAG: flagellar biosynthesis repressor FlbT [Rhizobiaceae bacterium]|jgi:flagellar protein FlbT|nr:flagellar biosynthesis repressor FlbT [Rhizobiaceae bacterium]
MTATLSLLLKAGDRIYLNGAVIRADRKVRIEVLNDATFLLGTHILQPEDARTPLRQLYFALQAMLMEPSQAKTAETLARRMAAAALTVFENQDIVATLIAVLGDLDAARPYPALKRLRQVFPLEALILAAADTSVSSLKENAA